MKLFATLALTLCTTLSTTLTLTAATPQQTRFSVDDPAVTRPVEIPQKVLAVVLRDKTTFQPKAPNDLDCVKHVTSGKEPKPQLLCAQLGISPMPGVNYIVIGAGSLTADHIAPIWIVHYEDDAATVLFKTRATSIQLLPTRSQGYTELQVNWLKDNRPTSTHYTYLTGSYQSETPPTDTTKKP